MKNMGRVFLILALLLPFTVLVSCASLAESKLEATIFSYDGKDFVRNETTLTAEGQSAANTKLDRESAAYKALIEKRSYTGPATHFGRDYQAVEPVRSDVCGRDQEATPSSSVVFAMALAPGRGVRQDQWRDALSLACGRSRR